MSIIQLEFLTQDERIIELCKKYWEVTPDLTFPFKTADLAREFDIKPTRLAATIAQSCNATAVGDICGMCRRDYQYTSRTDFVNRHRRGLPDWLCDSCEKREKDRKEAERAATEEKTRARIRARFGNPSRGPTDPRAISLSDAVYLLSVFRLGSSEDLRYIRALSGFGTGSLSPSTEYDREIFEQLFGNRLLFLHPDSPVDAFNSDLTTFSLRSVLWWTPLLSTNKSAGEFFDELESIFRSREWSSHWDAQSRPLWKRIAVEECLQYLALSLGEHGLILTPGEKTLHVLNNVLESYSVSQVFNFIWRAARDAAAFYMRERVAKQHAANTVVGAIQRLADKSKSEGWSVKGYQRNFKVPQSMVSRVFADTVMQFGDEEFTTPPRTGNAQTETEKEDEGDS